MQHIGSQVDWNGWLIGKTMAAEHVVKDAQFDGTYTTEWDSDGFGNAIWFDTLEETAEFITRNFPLLKNKKERAKQIKYMPLPAEHVYRQILGLRIMDGDKIKVVKEDTGETVDDNSRRGYTTEDDAWAGVEQMFSRN